jgi:hypothetical protein
MLYRAAVLWFVLLKSSSCTVGSADWFETMHEYTSRTSIWYSQAAWVLTATCNALIQLPSWSVLLNSRFELLTAVAKKSSIFWDRMPYSPVKVNRYFRGIHHLHLHGRGISQAIKRHEEDCDQIPLKRQSTFTGQYGVTSQTTEIFNIITCQFSQQGI